MVWALFNYHFPAFHSIFFLNMTGFKNLSYLKKRMPLQSGLDDLSYTFCKVWDFMFSRKVSNKYSESCGPGLASG